MQQGLKWTIRFTLFTPVLIIIVILFMGGGHGYFKPAVVIFPWAAIPLTWLTNLNSIQLFIAAIQYPIYGLYIDTFAERKGRKIAITVLIIIHIIIMFIILKNMNSIWNR